MAAPKKREQTPARRESTRKAVAKHLEKKKEENTNATVEAIANRQAIDVEHFDVLSEALDALSVVKAALTVAPPGSVASLANQQLKLSIEIDRYRREIQEQEEEEQRKAESVFDD